MNTKQRLMKLTYPASAPLLMFGSGMVESAEQQVPLCLSNGHQRPRFVGRGGQRLKQVELGYRFDEVCVKAYLGSALPILRLSPAGECNQRCPLPPLPAPHLSGGLVSIHAWHAEIEQDDFRLEPFRHGERLDAVVDGANVMTG
jgi:hypothetical protein